MGNFAAQRAGEIALRMESLSKAGQTDEAVALLLPLEQEMEVLVKALTAYRRGAAA